MSLSENLLNNLFNKFIAFFALTAIMLLGVLAIHSIKVDTLPLDRALGLIERTTAPAFTLKARAQQAVNVVNCGGQCANNQTIALIQAQRQSISSTIGGTIAIINATVASIMRILQMVKKVFNFFINLVQQFSGGDKSLFFILASVRQMVGNSNPLNDIYKNIKTEYNNISKNVNDVQGITNVKSAAKSAKQAESVWYGCIAATLAKEQGLAPSGVDVDKLCSLAVKGTSAVENALAQNTAASGAGNDIFGNSTGIFGSGTDTLGAGSNSSVSNTLLDQVNSSNLAGSGVDTLGTASGAGQNGDTTASTTSTGIDVASSLNFLFSPIGDPNVKYVADIGMASLLAENINQAKTIADNKAKQALSAQQWSPQCGLYVGQADATKQLATKTQFALSPGNSGIFAAGSGADTLGAGSNSSVSNTLLDQVNSSNLAGSGVDTLGGTASGAGNGIFGSGTDTINTSVFSTDLTKPVSFGFADTSKIDNYDVKALTPEQCSYAQDAANTTQNTINQANSTPSPAETAGGVAAVTNALKSAFALIKTTQDIYSTLTSFTASLLNVSQSFMSGFSSFFGGIGNIFAQAGVNNGNSQVLGISDALKNQVGSVPTLGLNNTAPIDDKGTTIDDSAFTTDQEKTAKYSDQSGDCILDSVKIKATGSAAEYKGADATLDTTKLPVVGVNNAQTYTNGSNVPDSVMGATVTDQNTPPISGLSFKKADGTTGAVPNTPSRSLISAGGSTNSINSTYHQCQASPWGDDNSAEIAGVRLATYPFDAKFGGPSAYRDGVSNDWRVVNNQMNKDVPDQCLLSNNDLSNADKQSIISQLGIQSDTNSDQAWQTAKTQLDEAQRQGKARWDPDSNLLYQNRVRSGLIIGEGDKKKEIQIKPGKCEVSYTKDEVNNALKARGWNFNPTDVKSFAALVN